MKKVSLRIADFAILLACLTIGLAACVPPASYVEIPYNGNGGNEPPPPPSDPSPTLGLMVGTNIIPLDKGATITISLAGTDTIPRAAILKVTNATNFNTASIEWRHSTAGALSTGADKTEYTVNPSAPGSPFDTKANHLLTVDAMDTNSRPYSTFITVRVVD